MNGKFDFKNAKNVFSKRIGIYKNTHKNLEDDKKLIFETRQAADSGDCMLHEFIVDNKCEKSENCCYEKFCSCLESLVEN